MADMSNPLGRLKQYRQLMIGLAIGLAVAIPTGLYIRERSMNSELQIEKVPSTEVQKEASEATKLAEAPTQDATTSNPVQAGTSNTTNLQKPSQTTTSTPQASSTQPTTTTPAPAPAPEPEPEPQYLATCLWQGPQNIGENCPYNPPSSWSYDYVKYPCKYLITSELVPCPNYKLFTGINNQAFSTDDRGLCQFTITALHIERNVFVTKAYGYGYPDCTTASPR